MWTLQVVIFVTVENINLLFFFLIKWNYILSAINFRYGKTSESKYLRHVLEFRRVHIRNLNSIKFHGVKIQKSDTMEARNYTTEAVHKKANENLCDSSEQAQSRKHSLAWPRAS